MPQITVPTRGDVARLALGGALFVSGAYLLRQASARKLGAAERLSEAMLDTERLRTAIGNASDASEKLLAGCAAYLIQVAYRSTEHLGAVGAYEDPVGYSRTQAHPYTRAAATVLTEATAPDHLLTYAIAVPEVGEVRGTRRIGLKRIAGLAPARPIVDTVQITLEDGYTAQWETEFEAADFVVTTRGRLYGAATVRDSRGNVGRINIGFDGTISGAVTRDARVIGRFEGKAAHGLQFKQYQLESGA